MNLTKWVLLTLTVLRKELKDSLRDRRSVTSGLLYSVFGPLLVVLLLSALGKSLGGDKPVTITVLGAERAPNLIAFLKQREVTIFETTGEATEVLRSGKDPVVLEIAKDYADDWKEAKPAGVRLVHDASQPAAGRVVRRLQNLLDAYAQNTVRWRLFSRGIDPTLVQPLAVQPLDISTAMARASRVLGSLPIFFLLAAFIGGMNVAIDTTAGERERGSLESLLCHAVPTSALATGKWLTASFFALLSLAITLGVSVLVFARATFEGLGVTIRFGWSEALGIFLVTAPLALMVPALQMLISIHAKNFKEAQTQLQLLTMVPMLPGFLLVAGALEKQDWMFWVPILGQQIEIFDLLAGTAIPAIAYVAGSLATLLITGILVVVLTRLFGSEKIVLSR